jgi:hypothetical protein
MQLQTNVGKYGRCLSSEATAQEKKAYVIDKIVVF